MQKRISSSRLVNFVGVLTVLALFLIVYNSAMDSEAEIAELQQPVKNFQSEDFETVKIQSHKKTLNLLFHFNFLPVDQGGNIFETDWIENFVFGGIERPLRIISMPQQYYNDSVSVFLFEPPNNMFQHMKDQGYVNFGSYHMGDEGMGNNHNFYSDASINFRNYYNAGFLRTYKNLMYVPLGTKFGLHAPDPKTFIPASRRQFLCNFVGSFRSNRGYMMEQLHYKRDSCYISADKGWADPSGVHVLHYRNVLLDSKFTLAPWGNNEESLRFYEALEFGSIPIAETSKNGHGDYINDGIGGEPPIPRVKDWNELDALLKHYDENPAELDMLQAKTTAWWQKRKVVVQKKIKDFIDASFKSAYGADV